MAHLKCDGCGTKFVRQSGKEIDRRRCNNDYSHYCSSCDAPRLANKKAQESRQQNLRERVGDRMITENGYVRVYVGDTYTLSDHVYCGSVFEHTLVMEQHLNRPLEKGEVVHHIDGDKQNNSIDNLDVMTVEDHNKCHGAAANELLFRMYKEGVITYDTKNHRYVR